MLKVKNLHAQVENKEILRGVDLQINAGEVHVIMGPNGSGKSTFGNVLAGREGYEVSAGTVTFLGENLLDLPVEERARQGLFLAFQYPIEIPGVTNIYLLRAAFNAMRQYRGEALLDALDFIELVKAKLQALQMDEQFLYRDVNVDFSGGEKKRNEILQMMLLEPKLAILDETDSGLDIDALRIVATGVKHSLRQDRSILLVTHYQRLLDYIEPDFVHVLAEGKIVKSGDKTLALELEKMGYSWLEK